MTIFSDKSLFVSRNSVYSLLLGVSLMLLLGDKTEYSWFQCCLISELFLFNYLLNFVNDSGKIEVFLLILLTFLYLITSEFSLFEFSSVGKLLRGT